MRQLIVRATNPRQRTVEVGILTDDLDRAASQIIHLMFNRRAQEKDFKYLDEHFGINPITRYASVAYERREDEVEQKQTLSGAYKALALKTAQLKGQLSTLLFPNISLHESPPGETQRIAAPGWRRRPGTLRCWSRSGNRRADSLHMTETTDRSHELPHQTWEFSAPFAGWLPSGGPCEP